MYVHATRDLVGVAALEDVAEAAGELHDLTAAGDLAAGVVDGLSVFGGDDPAEFFLVLDEELAEGEHDLGALGEEDSDQASKAREAASTAVSTSVAPPRTTWACSSPVAGLNTGWVSEAEPGVGEPLIQCSMVFTVRVSFAGAGSYR